MEFWTIALLDFNQQSLFLCWVNPTSGRFNVQNWCSSAKVFIDFLSDYHWFKGHFRNILSFHGTNTAAQKIRGFSAGFVGSSKNPWPQGVHLRKPYSMALSPIHCAMDRWFKMAILGYISGSNSDIKRCFYQVR